MGCCKDPSTLEKGRSVLIRVGKKKTTNKHRERGKKRKEKERKIRYDFSNNPPVLKPINACSDQGPPSQSSLGWEGLCH